MTHTLIPEWVEQDLVIIAWPHEDTDWVEMLDEIEACYVDMARTILRYQDLLVLTPTPDRVESLLEGAARQHRLLTMEMQTSDTWCRDYAPLSFVVQTPEGGEQKAIADYTFNGWGMKFASCHDNLVSRCLFLSHTFARDVRYLNRLMLVLEGGGVESDGLGTILSTESCLFEPNRNPGFSEQELRQMLAETLGADRLITLRHGELEGDDTDGHIDTLARFLSPTCIAYTACQDERDEHYHSLKRMEQELEALRTPSGEPYTLVALPIPQGGIYAEDGYRLPATYANFLFVNGALLVPTYDRPEDAIVLERLGRALPDREVVGINCLALIEQHGSLHCATMQVPKNFINSSKWQ